MGQVGVFPEQQGNWDWIEKTLSAYIARQSFRGKQPQPQPPPIRVLNAFGYTGGSTMASLVHETVQVTHLDASKSSHSIAKANVDISECAGSVRWVVDDCITFLSREIRRGTKYDALIFDPPAFGRFEGKTWQIDKDLPRLISFLPQLLSSSPAMVLLTCHDQRWPAKHIARLLRQALQESSGIPAGRLEYGTMTLYPSQPLLGKELDMGEYVRWTA